MNIYAEEGDCVVYLNKHGYQSSRDRANEIGLVEGGVYTVAYTDVSSSYTSVVLKEFPGESFNSVMFDDCIVDSQPNNTECDNLSMIPDQSGESFYTIMQDAQSISKVKVVAANHDMAICLADGPVYISKDQARAFFDLQDRVTPEANHFNDIFLAIKNNEPIEQYIEIPTWNFGKKSYEVIKTWKPALTIDFNLIHLYRVAETKV
jgi:hypothetical protein